MGDTCAAEPLPLDGDGVTPTRRPCTTSIITTGIGNQHARCGDIANTTAQRNTTQDTMRGAQLQRLRLPTAPVACSC
jgi:hypothetical protein